nr:class I SAM-dependent methyltransferase [Sphingomonas sp. H160509]
MMFGSRKQFEYRECDACASVWLAQDLTSEELSEYYGEGYYSYEKKSDSGLHQWILNRRDRAELGEWSPIGRVMAARRPNTTIRMIGTLGLSKKARILDVGCGGGRLLDRLKGIGFAHLMGVDPFVDAHQTSLAGVPIKKGYLADLPDQFDLIMFHHALEHTINPIDDLIAARKHLAPGGKCLVRIPTVSSHAWERYGVDWVQLDAPRHTAIPSRAGMAKAVALAGFRLADTIDDSTPFQFEGSERYRADVPLLKHDFPISPEDRARFVRDSASLNAQERGDQVGFVLAL